MTLGLFAGSVGNGVLGILYRLTWRFRGSRVTSNALGIVEDSIHSINIMAISHPPCLHVWSTCEMLHGSSPEVGFAPGAARPLPFHWLCYVPGLPIPSVHFSVLFSYLPLLPSLTRFVIPARCSRVSSIHELTGAAQHCHFISATAFSHGFRGKHVAENDPL